MSDFASLGLIEPLVRAVAEEGYSSPTPIQTKAIPAIIDGRDVMAAAQTGTGKTAGFTLPLLQRLSTGKKASSNQVRALILTPTRELAVQVADSVRVYSKHVSVNSAVAFGGVKINPQMMRLRRGADILVATPGRLLDLFQQNAIHFKQLECLVLDEADRMLDMGFIHDIKKIIALLPAKRQSLLFSATFSSSIRQLARELIRDPVEISVSPPNATAQTVKQKLHPVDKKQKPNLLKHLITEQQWHQALVFTRTKHGANKLARFLEQGDIKVAVIHGNKSQGARTRALADFKAGEVAVLVATDIAARGLDIDQLPHVVNFDLPNVPEDYVHRIGRTGRAGESGVALSLVSADELDQLQAIERLTKKLIEREYIDGFEPVHELPETKLNIGSTKPKKPKKPKPQNRNKIDSNKESDRGGQRKSNSSKNSPKPKNQKFSGKAKKTNGINAKNSGRKSTSRSSSNRSRGQS